MILAATGHRPPKLGGYRTPNFVFDQVIAATTRMLRTLQPELVISGMALGFDQWVAEICVELGIPFDAAVPFHGYESRWIDESKRDFERLLSQAHCVHYITNTHEYSPILMYRRNRWMVDHADQMMALWNGSDGGTANCVRYAEEKGKIINRVTLAPEVWTEAARIEQMLAARRAARELNRGALPAPIFAFRHAEPFPQGVPSAMPTPQEPPLAGLTVEEAARVLGAQIAQEYTHAMQEMVGDVRATRATNFGQYSGGGADRQARLITPVDANEILRDLFFDAGAPDGDRTVITVVQQKTEKKIEEERDRFLPGRIIDVDE